MDSRTNVEDENGRAAATLWQKLGEAGYEDPMERFRHFWRIVELASYVRLAPVGKETKASNVSVCLALGVCTDGQEMRAASSKQRNWMRVGQFDKNPHIFEHLYTSRKDVWSYEKSLGKTPSLVAIMKANDELPEQPPIQRRGLSGDENYGVCAEPAVFEKLNRVNAQCKFMYSLQKMAVPDPQGNYKYSAKIVPRCANCKVVHENSYYGEVVTDKDLLIGLRVPDLTLPAFRVIRQLTHSLTISHDPALRKSTTVFLDTPPGRIVIPRAGPYAEPEFDDEIRDAIQFWNKVNSGP